MGDLRIKVSVLGMLETNCYIVYREGGSEAVIIDPADNGAYIAAQCKRMALKPQVILLTHGHYDHIGAADELRRNFSIPCYAGEKEEKLLEDSSRNLTAAFARGFGLKADRLLKNGEELDLLGLRWKVIETPGHTAGSVCFYLAEEKTLFAGDTLFLRSFGRTDFPTGSERALVSSLTEILFRLPDDVKVYPGHGEATSIGYEKLHNPIVYYIV